MAENQQADPIIDLDVALTYTGGDHEMLVSIAELFLVEGPRQLRAVQTSVEQGDLAQTSSTAHTLKGSIVIFGASTAAAAAVEVELAAQANDATRVSVACDALTREMKRLVHAIEKLCNP